jgi:hypothetical protein
MTVREQIKVLRAFKRGSIIEWYNENSGMWLEIGNDRFTAFNFGKERYRIKPQPEYIPFTWEDRDLFRGKWVRWKFEDKEFTIDCMCERGLCFSGELFTWDRLFKDLEFIDGKLFGKLKP